MTREVIINVTPPGVQAILREAKARKMAKKIIPFGQSETDLVVRAWLKRNGIDENAVSGYSIFRHSGEVPRIMLEMYFDDTPTEVEAPIPPWCPAPPQCSACPGRLNSDSDQCIRWPSTNEKEG